MPIRALTFAMLTSFHSVVCSGCGGRGGGCAAAGASDAPPDAADAAADPLRTAPAADGVDRNAAAGSVPLVRREAVAGVARETEALCGSGCAGGGVCGSRLHLDQNDGAAVAAGCAAAVASSV